MLTIESRMVIIFRACTPIYYKHLLLLVSILEAKANHVPLKYRCLIKMSNQIRHIYLSQLLLGPETHNLYEMVSKP